MNDEIVVGNYKAVVLDDKANKIQGGPQKVFAVRIYEDGQLILENNGYEDYKFALAQAREIVNEKAQAAGL
jgi:hypothetical protein